MATEAHAAWTDAAWPYRRTIDVIWDETRGTGDELAVVDFYAAGHLGKPDGSDLRVATDQGKPVATKILRVGPGDRVRVVFALAKGSRKYAVYFGNPNPPPPDKGADEVPWKSGLMMEMRHLEGPLPGNLKQVEECWNKSPRVIGRTMVENVFLGVNPIGPYSKTVSKFTGSLFAPLDGDYLFALGSDDRGALSIDGQPLVYAAGAPGRAHFTNKLRLTRGRHLFELINVTQGPDPVVTVAWQGPDMRALEVIPRMAFGLVYNGNAGRLEQTGRTFVADFKVEYLGECFFADHYSHRYRFTAHPSAPNAKPTFDWDFGDGQSAAGTDVEHVYLTDGVYPVRLEMKLGGNSDAQTTRLDVHREYERLDKPRTEDPPAHAQVVEQYDLRKIPSTWLPWATLLHARARRVGPMVEVAAKLAAEPSHADRNGALYALGEATDLLQAQGKAAKILPVWAGVPENSDLQPDAARRCADLLLWWTGDFAEAVKVLRPFAPRGDATLQRYFAEALVLNQQADEGRAVLARLDAKGRLEKQVAVSGAMARTVEAYIDQKDWEAGEDFWERWQTQIPHDFLEGYSVTLRVKLMRLRNGDRPAAAVAEAFARAVPDSPYAPTLLDQAGKILAKTDAARSRELRDLLKKRYPEDPLSQDP